jgi:Cytochrome c554 and c-prime
MPNPDDNRTVPGTSILLFYSLVTIGIIFLSVLVAIKVKAVPESVTYVGSTQCQSCHKKHFHHWQSSLHAKMMRPVQGNTLADISESSMVAFEPTEAVWAIGSKWEQQFMGEVDGEQTLLPGAWMIADQQWELKNWDGWQVPEPLIRCHGCHTVGLDVNSGGFIEPSIGCESCHGPSSWHVKTKGLGKAYVSLDAQVCGQCHSRGKSSNGIHFFPVDFKPWQNLDEHFDQLQPYPSQTSSHWWGNGHARKRHQEYSAWQQGGHSNSLKSLTEHYDGRYGNVSSDCLYCHAAEATLKDKTHGLALDDVKNGISCAVCHNVHGQLDKLRMQCSGCHGVGAYYHQPEKNRQHVPCPNEADVSCVNCHMPLTGWNGGEYTLHSHSPKLIPPSDTELYGVPNSCANGGCHADKNTEWLQAQYDVLR